MSCRGVAYGDRISNSIFDYAVAASDAPTFS